MSMLPIYTVTANAETGEWITGALFAGRYIEKKAWHAKEDTDRFHFDTYEEAGETRAVRVEWV